MYSYISKILLFTVVLLSFSISSYTQINDNCVNSINIPIPGNGYGNGVVYTDTIDLSTATTEIGEYYSPGVPNGKSVWFNFSIETTKKVVILLDHLGTNALNTAGWSLYKTNSCLPGNPELLDPPIFQIEGYTHSCLLEGDYLLQLSADFGLSDSLFFQLDISPSDASEVLFDKAANAYDFGVVPSSAFLTNSYEIGCQSVFELENTCVPANYSKSTWQTFTTDNFVDLIRFRIGESPWNAINTAPRIWYLNLYEGDIKTDSTGLALIDSCAQMVQTGSSSYYNSATIDWQCLLDSNTTYSVQILSESEYFGTILTQVAQLGEDSTLGTNPNNLNPNNILGTLNLGSTYTVTDFFSCNSEWDYYSCPPFTDTIHALLPPANNPLNWFTTFNLPVASGLDINIYNYSGYYSGAYLSAPTPQFQLFYGSIEDSCSLIPIPTPYYCLDPGDYTVLVTGDGFLDNGYSFASSNLGGSATLSIAPTLNSVNQFDLQLPENIDSINGLTPLVPGSTYSSTLNYFDCETTVLPQNEICDNGGAVTDRAMYRLVHVDTSGYLFLSGGVFQHRYKVFAGNLANLPIVNDEIVGTSPISCCTRMYYTSERLELCVDSGLYTIVTYADVNRVDESDQFNISFNTFNSNPFNNPLTPEVLDTISLTNLNSNATLVQTDCSENPENILGLGPCSGYNNLTYREFYLADPLSLNFINTSTGPNYRHRVFAGRRSQNSESALIRDCFTSNTSNVCDTLDSGWYTIVTYRGVNDTIPYCGNSAVGDWNGINVVVNLPLDTPFYNTFPKADSVYLEWDQRINHTDTIPSQWQMVSLDYEQFNCFDDLVFPSGITSCIASNNRISYRVIHLEKASNLYIYNIGLQSRLYEGDITSNPAPYNIVHDCESYEMRLCLDSGVYTFVTFAGNAQIGSTFSANLYVDSLGISKYDYAKDAYNFGLIPNDGISYLYNPSVPVDSSADAYGRPASNDFIFCSTSAALTDPDGMCNTFSNASGERKTLWYTFELNQPGTCTVDVNTLTPGKRNVAWAIYEADNLTYPLVDSTLASLTLVAKSKTQCYYWQNDLTQLSFVRDACSAVTTKRYVVVISNTNRYGNDIYEEPNIQVEVGVTLDPIGATAVLYDHYSQANHINATPTLTCIEPYLNDTISYGTYIGCEGNLLCATLDPTDQNTCGVNTIWYKFNVEGSGTIKLNYERTDINTFDFNAADIQLYRSIIPGDSSSAGLQNIPLSSAFYNNNPIIAGNNRWGSACFSTGTYYIMFTGCNFPMATVKPNIWLENIEGDYCSDAIPYIINSEDSTSVSGTVDCWTIGEAPGEDGSNMDCLGTPVGKKSGWFRLVVANDSIYDIDISLNENTTAPASEFSYRIANGDCESLTYQNCVEDGGFLTLNLKCRQDSALYIQVVLPDYATGTVDLNVVTTLSTDSSCIPVNPFIPNASFNYEPTCENEQVQFVNESTQGPLITYAWDFGDGFTSNLENPSHLFSAPSTGSFLVTLIVQNDTLSDTTQRLITVLPTPDPVFTVAIPVVAGQTAGIINYTFDTLPGVEYFWHIGSLNNPLIIDTIETWNPNHTFQVPDEYYICLSVNNSYCESEVCDTIQVGSLSIFSGGPYDGFDMDFVSCEDTLLPIFGGGPYDGFDINIVSCPIVLLDVFSGGPYDGFDLDFTTCPVELQEIFSGGPYDGFDITITTCPVLSPFAGGPLDGAATVLFIEDCSVESIWSGGAYDGEGTDLYIETCIPFVNIFSGGPYDGFDIDITTCEDTLLAIFGGGPYDGFDIDSTICPVILLDIFSGGPYDGFDLNFTTCPEELQEIFSGGPYDGFDLNYTNCPVLQPIFSGGPYDGFDINTIENTANQKTEICINESTILDAGYPTNWYNVLTGGTALATDTNLFETPNLSNTSIYYYESVCYPLSERRSYVVDVLQNTTPDFSLSTSCAGQTTTFTNQTLVTGPQVQTVGPVIIGNSPTGATPTINNLSVSTSNYINFARFNDVNYGPTCWSENNTVASTEWLQVNYITPKSVNEIDLWHYYANANYHPEQVRLYYSNGGPWTLVYVDQNPENNTVGRHYNTNKICPSANIYANRWKIEFDTKAGFRFNISEFNLFASDAVIGGNVNWNINGTPATGQNVTYNFPNPGFYDVVLEVNDSCSCTSIDTVQVEIVAVDDVELLVSNVVCQGVQNGQLELEISTSDPINFYWFNNDSNSLILDSLGVGNYWIFVENIIQGCGDTIFANITEPDTSLGFSSNILNADSCTGYASVEITGVGGYSPYTIVWNSTDTLNIIDSIIGWNYFEIIDLNGCIISDSINVLIPINVDSTVVNNTSCLPTDTGEVIQTFSGLNGCDSVYITITSLLLSDSITVNNTSCNPVDTGIVIDSLTNANGCDSVVTTITTLLLSDSTYVTATSCLVSDTGFTTTMSTNVNGCDSTHTLYTSLLLSDSITVNNTSCNPVDTGIVVDSLTNVNGCDSVVTTITSLLSFDSLTINLTSCNPIDTGIVVDSLINANGCDSVVTTITTLLPSDSSYAIATSCLVSDTGFATTMSTNVNGCDSTHTVYTSLLLSDSITVNNTSCNPVDTGIVVDSLTNVNGCDSVVTTITTLLLSDSSYTTATSCLVSDTGITTTMSTNVNGCDSTHTVYTSLLISDSITVNNTSCNPIDTGIVVDSLINANGCDSVVTTITTLLPSDSSYAIATSCLVSDTGITTTMSTNVNGCDSTHTVYTSLLISDTITVNNTSCNPVDTGIVVDSLTNANGCDSVVTTITTLLLSDSTYATATSCLVSDTGYTTTMSTNVNGCDSTHTVYTSLLLSDTITVNNTSCNPVDTGIVVDSLTNVNGCDSVVTTITSLLSFDSLTINLTSCNPVDTGIVVDSLTNVNGCDSVVTTITSLLSFDSLTINLTSCNPIDTGIVVDSLTNVNGCDSVVTTITTLLPSDSSYATATSCLVSDTGIVTTMSTNVNGCDSTHTVYTSLLFSDSITVNNTSCNPIDTGIVVDSLTNVNGCDSVVTTITTLLPSDSTYSTATSCLVTDTGIVTTMSTNMNGCDSTHTLYTSLLFSDSITVNNTSCNPIDTGIVVDSLTNANGCDSVVTTITSLLSFDSLTINLTSCNPIDTGIVVDSLTNVNGCDSVVTTITTLLLSDSTYATTTSCLVTDTGFATTMSTNVNGCDSTHTVYTSLLSSDSITVNNTSCNSVDTGIVVDSLTNANGCDSVVTTITTLLLSDSTYATATSCLVSDTGYTTTMSTNVNGCDSTHTVYTSLLLSDTITVNNTSCNPVDTGIVVDSLTNVNGCDSVVTTITSLLSFDSLTINLTSCNPVDTGIVVDSLTNVNGCDSVVTTITSLLSFDSLTINLTSCNPIDTGIVVDSLTNVNGCDSVVTTITTLLPSDSSYATATSCLVSDTGIVTTMSTNVNGCDSTHTVYTSLLFSDSITVNNTSCNPIDTGIVVDSLTNVNGCDSVVTTITTLLPSDSTYSTATSCLVTDTGIVTTMSTNMNGCDSTHTLYTSLLFSDSITVNNTSCNPIDTGIVVDSLTNANGCDSVVTTITSLLSFDSLTINLTSCNPIDTGIVVDSLTNVNGCDSVVTTITTLLLSDSTYATTTSCLVTDTGFATTMSTNVNGCDSTHTVYTSLLSSDSITVNNTSCNPIDTGIVVDSLTNANGCDSVVTTITSLLSFDSLTINLTSCNPIDTGIVVDSLTNVNGCDSVVTTITTLLSSDSTYSTATSCLPIDTGFASTMSTNVNGCDSTHTLYTSLVFPNPLSDPLADTTFCSDEIEFVTVSENGQNFEWNDGSYGPYLLPDTSGIYIVNYTQDASGCLVSDTISITIENCIANCIVALPTAFSPDATNGVNDIYRLITNCEKGFSNFEFRIFNRWGELIYFTDNPNGGWDGFYKGVSAEIGVYTYSLEYTKNLTNQNERMTGNVTLIR